MTSSRKDTKNYGLPAAETADAVRVLCECLTPRDKELLKIERNGQVAPVEVQLISRWWNYVPNDKVPLTFKTKVLQILATHGRLLDLLEKVKQHDIFAALLDPENYKLKSLKSVRSKSLLKSISDSDSSSVSLSKNMGRGTDGTGAINRAYDYGKEWEEEDKKKLDSVQIKKSDTPLYKTETGEEDDTPETEGASWMERRERLDQIQGHRLASPKASVEFSKIQSDTTSKNDILFYNAGISQGSGISSGESYGSANALSEALTRQEHSVAWERLVLADALNNIQNIEFLDIREKFYKYFDPLFSLGKSSCH